MAESRRTRALDLAIELQLIALLAFLPAAFGGVHQWAQAIAYCLAWWIALALCIHWVVQPPTFARAWIWIPPLLFILIAAVQLFPMPAGVMETFSPQTFELKRELLDDLPDAGKALSRMTVSFYELATRDDLRLVMLATTVMWAVVVVVNDRRRMHRMLWALTLIGGAAALLALLQDVTRTEYVYWSFWANEPARSGPFFNHSHYSQFMNLAIGAALGLLLVHLNEEPAELRSAANHVVRIGVPAFVIVLGLATISLSLSRGGMLSIAGAGLFTMVVLLSRRATRWLGGVVAFLGVLAVIALAFYGIERVQGRLQERGGISSRVQMVRDAWVMSKQFPVTGIGLGTFEWVYTMYDRTNTPAVASHVENEYVQTLVEMGWAGLLLVMAMVGIVAWHWWRAVRSRDLWVAGAAAGLGYGIVAVMVHSFSEFGQHIYANACWSAALCGMIVSLGTKDVAAQATTPPRARWMFGAMGLVVMSASVWVLVEARGAWIASERWRQANRAVAPIIRADWEATRAQYDEAIAHAQGAIDAQPGNVYYRYWTALYRWRESRRTREDDDPMLLPEAKQVAAELHEARRLCPTYGPIYSILGQIEYAALGLPIGLTHLQTAARLEPNDSQIQFAAARADARRGRFEEAKPKFRRAIMLDGSTIEDVIAFYVDEMKRPELAIDVASDDQFRMFQVAAALDQMPQYKDLAYQAFVKGTALLEKQCQDPNSSAWDLATLAARYLYLKDDAAAEKYFARALEKDYTNVYWRPQRAEILHRLGRVTEAIEEAQRAVRQHPESAEAKRVFELVSKPIVPK